MAKRKKNVVKSTPGPKSSITTDVGGTPPNGDNSNVNILDKGTTAKPVNPDDTLGTTDKPTLPPSFTEGEHTNVTPVLPIEGAVSPVVEHPAFDYDGKVKLSDHGFDYVDKKHALKVVKESHVYEKYKDDLTKQIKANKIEPNYVEMLRMIISADDKGQKYSGTLEG